MLGVLTAQSADESTSFAPGDSQRFHGCNTLFSRPSARGGPDPRDLPAAGSHGASPRSARARGVGRRVRGFARALQCRGSRACRSRSRGFSELHLRRAPRPLPARWQVVRRRILAAPSTRGRAHGPLRSGSQTHAIGGSFRAASPLPRSDARRGIGTPSSGAGQFAQCLTILNDYIKIVRFLFNVGSD